MAEVSTAFETLDINLHEKISLHVFAIEALLQYTAAEGSDVSLTVREFRRQLSQ